MKRKLIQCLLFAGWLAGGAAGCSNREIDTAKLQSAFQSATPDVRGFLAQGVAAIHASNYSQALPALQHAAYAAKMNPEQRLILEDAIKKVKARAK